MYNHTCYSNFLETAYFGVGWLWYIGTLFPVIGLVQAGLLPAMADWWVYVPFIGLFVSVSWGGGICL